MDQRWRQRRWHRAQRPAQLATPGGWSHRDPDGNRSPGQPLCSTQDRDPQDLLSTQGRVVVHKTDQAPADARRGCSVYQVSDLLTHAAGTVDDQVTGQRDSSLRSGRQ